jgi:hypothetical protein
MARRSAAAAIPKSVYFGENEGADPSNGKSVAEDGRDPVGLALPLVAVALVDVEDAPLTWTISRVMPSQFW